MTDAASLDVEGETPVNPYSLLEALNRSSDTAHMAWLIFLGIMAYLLIAVAGVTHKDLLLATPVHLPILGVQIQQVQFFQFAPVLLVLFHLGLVSQLVLLARKTLEFDNAVRQLEPTSRRSHPLRLELHNFFLVQAIAGPHRSIIMGSLLHAMSWLTLVIIPVVLLLFIQVSFLPYHSVGITWIHRIALVVDIAILGLLGVFLTRAETSFFQAFWRAILTHPVSSVVTVAVLTAVMFVSFVIATIPGEGLDRSVRKIFEGRSGEAQAGANQASGYLPQVPIAFLFGSSDGSLFGMFHRNLIVTDRDLVVDRDVSEGERSISLRGRDLRYAQLDRSDLHQADFTGANLDGASLVGTDLTNARFNCIDERQLILDVREKAGCASARRANFNKAILTGASMNGMDLRFSDVQQADLQGVKLKFALLSGANLSSANLQRADLTGGVKAHGAQLLLAEMAGADLSGAELQYADLSYSQMQGATLPHAQLQGAFLRDADMRGASLQQAALQGADFSGAILYGVDLSGARVWKTLPPTAENLKLADLRGLEIQALVPDEKERLAKLMQDIASPELRANVQEKLAPLLSDQQQINWTNTNEARVWEALYKLETPGVVSDYRAEMTEFLANMACRRRWSNGSVAEGIARRAAGNEFDGSIGAIYQRLARRDDCEGGKHVSELTMTTLQNAAEASGANVEAATSAPTDTGGTTGIVSGQANR